MATRTTPRPRAEAAAPPAAKPAAPAADIIPTGGGSTVVAATTTSAAPTLGPPIAGAAITAGGVGTWQSDKRVGALWCHNSTRNAYAYINGVGWKKLSDASDGGLMALTELVRLARDKGARVDYREEADGAIHEIYLW